MSGKVTTLAIVGLGHRGLGMGEYALRRPDRARVVAVADPDGFRRASAAKQFGLSPEQCFHGADELAAKGRLADAAINGTMDREHVATTLPLLRAGYDVLLEKPFATEEGELWTLVRAVRASGRKVMICHVLRYAPFYAAIRKRVLSGEIGEIRSMQFDSRVSYHHMAVGYVRGKWHRKDVCGSSMLMAKCCHDLDLMVWMKSGTPPRRVSSFGGRSFFRADKAPAGSGTHCLVDCPIEQHCLYSARKHYIDHPTRWAAYVWRALEHKGEATIEEKIAHLKEADNPFGRCVWKCDNNVVDHQSVLLEFADGTSATFNMTGGCASPSRGIHLLGTRGEILGDMDEDRFVVRRIDPRPGHSFSEEVVTPLKSGDKDGAFGFGGHGGGDERLVDDFVSFVQGDAPSISCTTIEDSILGHMVGFLADRAMERGCVLDVPAEAYGGRVNVEERLSVQVTPG